MITQDLNACHPADQVGETRFAFRSQWPCHAHHAVVHGQRGRPSAAEPCLPYADGSSRLRALGGPPHAIGLPCSADRNAVEHCDGAAGDEYGTRDHGDAESPSSPRHGSVDRGGPWRPNCRLFEPAIPTTRRITPPRPSPSTPVSGSYRSPSSLGVRCTSTTPTGRSRCRGSTATWSSRSARVVALTPGRLLTVPPGVPHRVRGMDETAFLLTIGGAHHRS